MDFDSNDERNKRNRYFNIIFLGIFLTEIIIYIIGIVILPIRSDFLIILVSVIFISGIYTFFKKTLLYLSAFCVVNMIQCIILIDFASLYRYTIILRKSEINNALVDNNYYDILLLSITKLNVIKKFYEDNGLKNEFDEKKYRTTFIIPNIIAIVLIIVFVILYIILIFMTWKNEYWDFISRTKIFIPNDKIKKSYIIYKFYNFLLYIILHFIIVFHLISISSIYYDPYLVSVFGDNYIHYLSPIRLSIIVINFLSLYTLLLSLKIIRKELKFSIFLIYGALIVQCLHFYFWLKLRISSFAPAFPISIILGLIFIGLTFINTILCHRNFGKNHILLLKFNPNLNNLEYEYSNDLDDDDDDDEEEEEKDEKISEKLNRYWKFIKKTSILLVEYIKNVKFMN
ncbi:hypothetical protein RhiirA4_444976 [Rhizophagus irregularis]|uniref:Uncharacterized protein n=1 Tax=Rhizophagus irregularis TaxID=588596 RepID=A0A2I1GM06_9GLOM|nr:hypothetical protein RhiirA4_444976 [Rhizophagus irregularis]